MMSDNTKYIAFLDECGLRIIAESRGTKEDGQLLEFFNSLIDGGEFAPYAMQIEFVKKNNNVIGLQMSDLCAYPSARHVLAPDQDYLPFEVIKKHLYHGCCDNLLFTCEREKQTDGLG